MLILKRTFSCFTVAPRIYMNKAEETTTTLIDNNSTTCVQLTGSDGCTRDKVYFLYSDNIVPQIPFAVKVILMYDLKCAL